VRTVVIGTLELCGDSTLRGYSAKTCDLRAVVEIADGVEESADLESLVRAGRVKHVELIAPIKGLTSGDGTLDRHLAKALRSDEFEAVRFVADSFEVQPPSAPRAPSELVARGRLTVAGVERPVVMTMRASPTPGGIRVAGSQNLLMSDYGIEPPTLLLGALRAADLVVVKFDVELRRASRA
jgi:polyisoprenoid-binding protein YceI